VCWILLGAALIAPRLAVLRQGLWHDEIYTVNQYISRGPEGIWGYYDVNDHMLFSFLAWLTIRVPGGPDVAYRLWGMLPFLGGVGLTAWWLRSRAGNVAAVAFVTLAATSNRLLDLTTEARGYGLAFFAMSILVISSYEATRSGRRGWLSVLCAAAVIGTWTLPTFIVPSLASAIALAVITPSVRRPLFFRALFSGVAITAWYVPVLSGILRSTGQNYGQPLPWHAPLTGALSLFTDGRIRNPIRNSRAGNVRRLDGGKIPAREPFPQLSLGTALRLRRTWLRNAPEAPSAELGASCGVQL
jgi:hypothetical protein